MKKLLLLLLSFYGIQANESIQNLHRYFLANYYHFGDQLAKAAEWYKKISPESDYKYVYLGYIPFLAANKSYHEIVNLIPQLDEFFKANREIQMAFAVALENVGRKNDARSRLVLLAEQYKTDQELTFKVTQMYMERAELENALATLRSFLNNAPRRPNNYIFHFMAAQIYLQLNKRPEALAAIQKSIEAYPKFDKSWLFYAILQEQAGKLSEALQSYTTFLEITPETNAEIERHVTTLAFRQKLLQQKTFIKEDSTESRMSTIEELVQKKEFDRALQLLGDWIISDKNPELWLKIVHLICFVGTPYKKALDMLHIIEKQKGSSPLLALYQADLALRNNDSILSLELLKKADKVISNPLLKAKIKFQIGILYYEQEEWKLTQTILEQAHKLDPDYPPLNNLLAYYYASKKNNLAKAKEHIAQSLKQDSENPHFLDTQAFIYYQEEKYDEALKILQKIAQSCPTDYTILHHLGKCYAKKGDMQAAVKSIQASIYVAKNDHEKQKAELLLSQWTTKK